MTKPPTKAGTSKAAAGQRKKAFVAAYLTNGRNATQAAITAGYSAKTARSKASQLLADVNISVQVAEASEKAQLASGLTVERTLQEVARIAYFDPRALYREDGNLKRPDEWDDDTAAAVANLEVLEEYSGRGEDRELIGHTRKLKLWDKNAALDKAMKHLGLYERDNAQLSKPVSIKMVFE